MSNKPCIALGVTGSIAAYKAAELTSLLVKSNFEVVVVMTSCAQQLVTPATFFTLSRNPVITDLFELPDWHPGHIALSERAQLFVVAPATANVLAKMTYGLADDPLSTCLLAHSGPLLVAPAMNPNMWNHPATRDNLAILRQRGVKFVGPASGNLACGVSGTGRMAEPSEILAAVLEHFQPSRPLN